MIKMWNGTRTARRCERRVELRDQDRSRRKLGSEAGLTLIELLVVLAIFSILAGISFSYLQRYQPRMQLNLSTNNVDTLLKRSRLQAVKRSTDVEIRLEEFDGTPVTVAQLYTANDPSVTYRLAGYDEAGAVIAWAPVPNPAIGGDNNVGLRDLDFTNQRLRFLKTGGVAEVGDIKFGYVTDVGKMLIRELAVTNLAGNIEDTRYEYTGYLP